jgi:hypothetical protein
MEETTPLQLAEQKKKGIGSKAESSSCHCPNKQYLDRYMFTSPIAMQSIIAK